MRVLQCNLHAEENKPDDKAGQEHFIKKNRLALEKVQLISSGGSSSETVRLWSRAQDSEALSNRE